MFGVEDVRPQGIAVGDKQMIFPVEKFSVKIMFIGFFIDKKQSLIWRGSLVSSAVTQLYENTVWEDIDYMIVDFPPGTGDIQLATIQKLNLKGAIIVTTSKEIALHDALK